MLKKITLLTIFALLISLLVVQMNVMAWYTNLDFENIPKYDFGGEEVYIIKDRGYGLPEEGTEEYEHWQKVEEYFNVDIVMERLGANSQDEMLTKMMAGDKVDLIRCAIHASISLMSAEAVMPLTDIFAGGSFYDNLNLPEFIRYEMDIKTKQGSYQGEIYGNQSYDRDLGPLGAGATGAGGTWYWNQSMFERENIPNVYELLENGEWTYDTVLNIARKLKKDTDGDGEIDQFGIDHRLSSRNFYSYLPANNAALTKDIDGRIVFTLNAPEALEMINMVKPFFEENLTLASHPRWGDIKVGWPGTSVDQFAKGNLGLLTRFGIGYLQLFNTGSLDPENMEDDWGYAPLPTINPGDNIVPAAEQDYQAVMVPVTTRYEPEKLLTLYYALYPRDPNLHEDLLEFYSHEVRDKETLAAIEKYFLNLRGAPEVVGTAARHWTVTGANLGGMMRGELDPASYLDEIAPERQARLDDLFN